MRKYEVMYIVNASLDDATRQEVMERMHAVIVDNGGKIINVDEANWGLRDFAYPIEDMTKGYYVVLTFEADNVALKEFDRKMHIESSIIRFMTIKTEE